VLLERVLEPLLVRDRATSSTVVGRKCDDDPPVRSSIFITPSSTTRRTP
jgi:hypothetical protein